MFKFFNDGRVEVNEIHSLTCVGGVIRLQQNCPLKYLRESTIIFNPISQRLTSFGFSDHIFSVDTTPQKQCSLHLDNTKSAIFITFAIFEGDITRHVAGSINDPQNRLGVLSKLCFEIQSLWQKLSLDLNQHRILIFNDYFTNLRQACLTYCDAKEMHSTNSLIPAPEANEMHFIESLIFILENQKTQLQIATTASPTPLSAAALK